MLYVDTEKIFDFQRKYSDNYSDNSILNINFFFFSKLIIAHAKCIEMWYLQLAYSGKNSFFIHSDVLAQSSTSHDKACVIIYLFFCVTNFIFLQLLAQKKGKCPIIQRMNSM